MEKIIITGKIEQYLTDIHGVNRKISEHHNTISSQFYNQLAKYLWRRQSGDLLIMSDYFNSATMQPDTNSGSDGIVSNYEPGEGGANAQLCFACSDAVTATQFIVTGVFTNASGTTKLLGQLALGNSWIKNQGWEAYGDGGFFSNYELAYGGMANVSVPLGEVLTVVWTINFTAH